MRSLGRRVLLHVRASPWLIPLVGLWLLADVTDWLVESVGEGRAAGIVVLVGAVLGSLWYLGTPRPLAERLYPWVLFAAVVTVLVACGGELEVEVPFVYSVGGVIGGLVVAERFPVSWRRQRQMAFSTRRSMAEQR